MSAFNNLSASELLSLLSTGTLLELFKKSIHGNGDVGNDGGIITATLIIHELVSRNQLDKIGSDLFSIEDESLLMRLCGEAVNAKRSVGSRISRKSIELIVPASLDSTALQQIERLMNELNPNPSNTTMLNPELAQRLAETTATAAAMSRVLEVVNREDGPDRNFFAGKDNQRTHGENPFRALRSLRTDPSVSKGRVKSWLVKYLKDCHKMTVLAELERNCELYRSESKEQFCERAFDILARISDERDEAAGL